VQPHARDGVVGRAPTPRGQPAAHLDPAGGGLGGAVGRGGPRAGGAPISFWTFTRYGAIVAGLTIALAAPYVWLRYFVYV